MRCKACDRKIPEGSMFRKVNDKMVLEDLCSECRSGVYVDTVPNNFAHPDVVQGISPKKEIKN